ncbi:MAG: restriction endonuclease subunit S [Gammaproteobacteria bacterium]|nr:restriction endonuclease subunit S [Gammaproteobacteria bacterium]
MMAWHRYTLEDIAPATTSNVFPNPEDIVWHLGLEDIESGTGVVLNKHRAPASDARTSTYSFDQGHVLYSKLRPYLNKVVVPDEPGMATTELIPLRPRPEIVCRDFLSYYLRSPSFVRYASHYVTGAKMPRVILDRFWQHEVHIPPLSEQHRIVELLDEVDQLRRLRSKGNAKADRIPPALFLKMFGDPVTNPMRWPVKPLGEIGQLDRGRSRHRPRNDPALLGGPYPLVQTGEVANSKGRIREYSHTYSERGLAQSKLWPAGTLCITIAANIANTGVLEFDACFPDSIVGFVPGKQATTEYVQFVINRLRNTLDRNAPQLAEKTINLKVLRSLPVPVPPIELQRRFSDLVKANADYSSRQESVQCHLNRLFESTMARALSGDLTCSSSNFMRVER